MHLEVSDQVVGFTWTDHHMEQPDLSKKSIYDKFFHITSKTSFILEYQNVYEGNAAERRRRKEWKF